MISKKENSYYRRYARKEGDTGSPEVQIAILTARIQELTEHLKNHPKDHPQTWSAENGWTETWSACLP